MEVALRAKLSNPDVIIGPPCQEGIRLVAQLGAYWNLPVFTWYNPGLEFDSTHTYPTLVRMIPSLNTMGLSLLHLLRQNKWNQFAFIYDESAPWTLYEEAIRVAVAYTEVNMLSSHAVNSTVTDTNLWQMFRHIMKKSWVVVFACPMSDIRRYMLIADQAGMGNGNYVFIQLDHQLHSENVLNSVVLTKQRWMKGDAQDQAARRIYQSLIHILLDPMNDDKTPTYTLPRNRYEEFSRMALPEASKQNPGWKLPVGGQPDVYSLYLYDAILVWSVLVDRLNTAGKNYRDGKLLTQEAKQFFADGATGYFALNNNVDRLAKMFILYMENDGSFIPSQILRFNSSDGYDVINIKPVHEQTRSHGGQTVTMVNQLNAMAMATTTAPTTTTTTTTTVATIATSTPKPIKVSTKKVFAMPAIPPPPPVSGHLGLENVLNAPNTDPLLSRLLAKVQSLEKTIKEHELHSHAHIPDHSHTPHPLLLRLSSTSAPPGKFGIGSQKPLGGLQTQAYHNHQITTPFALSLENILGSKNSGHAHFPHGHIHVPVQPTNQIQSAVAIHGHAPVPPEKFALSSQKPVGGVQTQAYHNHQITTPFALSLQKILSLQNLGHAHFPNSHIHVPTPPINQIKSVTDMSKQQATSALIPTVYNHAHHPHHWHPHPHYPQYNQGHHGQVPGTIMHHVYVPTTHRPSPPPPVQTTLAPTTTTTTTLPPKTTAAPSPTPAAHELFNGNGQLDEAMLDRISSNIVDQLTGTATNTKNINRQERRIVNDWFAGGLGLDELAPIMFAAQAMRENRLLQHQRRSFLQQSVQNNSQNNQQQTQNTQTNNQGQLQASAQPQMQRPPFRDPFAVLDPLAGFWDPPVIW